MAGYIGKSQGVTQVDGYNRTEADDRYVNASGDTMTGDLALPAGGLTVGTDQLSVDASGNVLVGTTSGDVFTNQTRISVNGTNYGGLSLFSGGSRRGQAVGSSSQFEITSSGEIPLLLGTNDTERMRIDGAGRVTMPYQPAFYAGAATGSYTAGSVIAFSNTAFDRGNNFNTANSRFVAPVSGIYNLSIGVYLYNTTAQTVAQSIALRINGSQATLSGDNTIFYQGQTAAYDNMVMASLPVSLSANDYVDIGVRIGGSTLNVYGGHTYFSGYLIG